MGIVPFLKDVDRFLATDPLIGCFFGRDVLTSADLVVGFSS